MTSSHLPASPITDRDRRRACRMAHAFGAAAAADVALVLLIVTRFDRLSVPIPALFALGAAVALGAGLVADLIARPARVLLGGDCLAVSRRGRWQRVRTDRLAGLSANPRVAGSLVLMDEDGNRAEVDVRVLVRNPLIWQRVYQGVSGARRRGSLPLADADARFWEAMIREVAEADRRELTSIDFPLPR